MTALSYHSMSDPEAMGLHGPKHYRFPSAYVKGRDIILTAPTCANQY